MDAGIIKKCPLTYFSSAWIRWLGCRHHETALLFCFSNKRSQSVFRTKLSSRAAYVKVNLSKYLSLHCKDWKKPEKTKGWTVCEGVYISPSAARCDCLSRAAHLAEVRVFTDFPRRFLSSPGDLFQYFSLTDKSCSWIFNWVFCCCYWSSLGLLVTVNTESGLFLSSLELTSTYLIKMVLFSILFFTPENCVFFFFF